MNGAGQSSFIQLLESKNIIKGSFMEKTNLLSFRAYRGQTMIAGMGLMLVASSVIFMLLMPLMLLPIQVRSLLLANLISWLIPTAQ